MVTIKKIVDVIPKISKKYLTMLIVINKAKPSEISELSIFLYQFTSCFEVSIK
ncbi:hypothetical protein THALO_380043 [Tenacibaculum halocynthiae]